MSTVHLEAESHILKDRSFDRLRLIRIVTTNSYKDREGEIITQKALTEYADRCWKDGDFIGNNPLLVWHGGDPIGDIIHVEMSGQFLIEIAQERPNRMINLARAGEAPLYAEIKSVWDALEREPDWAASHEFAFIAADRLDGIYEHIEKTETSVLPRFAAANILTDGAVLKGV